MFSAIFADNLTDKKRRRSDTMIRPTLAKFADFRARFCDLDLGFQPRLAYRELRRSQKTFVEPEARKKILKTWLEMSWSLEVRLELR